MALPHLEVYGGIRRFLELGRVWIERGHDVAIGSPGSPARPWLPFTGRIVALEAFRSGGWDALLSPDPALFLATEAPGALRVFYAVLEGAPGAERACRRADLVLANSAGMRRHLGRLGVRAIDAAGAVNAAFFRPQEPDPRPMRSRAGGAVRALVYGRLSRKRKGSWSAALALERAARSTGVETELTLFDSPPGEETPPTLPRALSIPHRWVLNPTQEELAALYRDADLFVSAERRAGWCNTAAEAMASGAAVVCTKSGTVDFAVDGETAAVSRWPWSWTLARRIAPLLRDPDSRIRMAARGRSRIAEFSWERTADRIEAAIVSRIRGALHAPVAS